MYQFEYHKPKSVAEAASLLAANPDAKLLAGGQTLIPTLKQRLASPSDVIDISTIAELKGIKVAGDVVTVGAGTLHADVASSKDVQAAIPALASLAGNIGDAQVRNRGTLGGSISNNDPAADYPGAVVALGATVVTNKRRIAGGEFFTGMFETALAEGEIVTAVEFPKAQKANYQKFPNPASRYAMVGVFIAVTSAGVRVAVTGAGPTVFRWTDAEAALSKSLTADALNGVKASADGLNADIHASADYRAHLIGVLAKRAVAALG